MHTLTSLTIVGGRGLNGQPEAVEELVLRPGELYTIVGHTGAGKSRLIKDVEQLVSGDSATGRLILLDGHRVEVGRRTALAGSLVAHLSQSMRFVLDVTVAEFITLHARCRRRMGVTVEEVLAAANGLTQEHIALDHNLNALSGGQTRALMIADVALVCDSPIVLIDEVENAGIHKGKALSLLAGKGKLVLIVTHDPHTALMASRRIVLQNGAMLRVMERSEQEVAVLDRLAEQYEQQLAWQRQLREGRQVQ